MIVKYLVTIFFLILNLYANIQNAVENTDQVLVVEVSSDYVLGDQDTRVSAKEIAMQQAKVLASEYAGTYIESEMVLQNDQIIKDKVATITMAFMSSEVLSENYSITQDGRTRLELLIKAKLDKNVFKQKVEALKADDTKAKQIAQLQQENERLLAELTQASRDILAIQTLKESSANIASKNSAIRATQERVLKELSQNQKKVVDLIDVAGLKDAMQKQRQTKIDEDNRFRTEIENDLYNNVVLPIKNNTIYKMDTANPKVVNGQTLIQVTWEMDPKVLETLRKYFYYDLQWHNYKTTEGNKYVEDAVFIKSYDTYNQQLTWKDKFAYDYLASQISPSILLNVKKKLFLNFKDNYGWKVRKKRTPQEVEAEIEEAYLDWCIQRTPGVELEDFDFTYKTKSIKLAGSVNAGNSYLMFRIRGKEWIEYNEHELDELLSTELVIEEDVDIRNRKEPKNTTGNELKISRNFLDWFFWGVFSNRQKTIDEQRADRLIECLEARGTTPELRYYSIEKRIERIKSIEAKMNITLPILEENPEPKRVKKR